MLPVLLPSGFKLLLRHLELSQVMIASWPFSTRYFLTSPLLATRLERRSLLYVLSGVWHFRSTSRSELSSPRLLCSISHLRHAGKLSFSDSSCSSRNLSTSERTCFFWNLVSFLSSMVSFFLFYCIHEDNIGQIKELSQKLNDLRL